MTMEKWWASNVQHTDTVKMKSLNLKFSVQLGMMFRMFIHTNRLEWKLSSSSTGEKQTGIMHGSGTMHPEHVPILPILRSWVLSQASPQTYTYTCTHTPKHVDDEKLIGLKAATHCAFNYAIRIVIKFS